MDAGGHPDCGVCAAVDVHYLGTAGARAAAVLAADATFAYVQAERTAVVPWVPPYRPSEFYLRELPPLRAVLEGLRGLGLLVVDGYADLDPGGRPAWAPCARRVRHPGDRGGKVQVPHGDPCAAGPARILGAPVVRHRRGDARTRRGGPSPPHGRPVPASRRAAPRRHPRTGSSARNHRGRPPARLTYAEARNAAEPDVLCPAGVHNHTSSRAIGVGHCCTDHRSRFAHKGTVGCRLIFRISGARVGAPESS
jgi:hypothetical protein